MMLLDQHATATDERAPLYPNMQRPLRPEQIAFRTAFAAAYARTGNAPGSVREAVALCGGSAKSRRRPSEVARLLLQQEPVRARILALGGTLPAIDPTLMVAPVRPPAPMPPPMAPPAIPQPVAAVASVVAQVSPAAMPLAPDTAARLAAVAFDCAMPPGVCLAALRALADACRTRAADLGGRLT